MNNTIKAVAAGAVAAVGTHYGDQYVHGDASPHKPIVYYGAAAVGVAAALWLRKKHPVVAGTIGGAAIGSAYQGYSRSQQQSAPAINGLLVPSLLAAEQNAAPRNKIGLPIARRSKTGDTRAFNQRIAPYGVSTDGYPLRSDWPYGLDMDRFAKPRPPSLPQSNFTPDDILEQGQKLGQGAQDLFNQGYDAFNSLGE